MNAYVELLVAPFMLCDMNDMTFLNFKLEESF